MSTTTGDPLTRRSPSLWSRIVRHWQLYVLLAPAIIYLIVFKYWPMYGVQIAFRNYNPIDGFMGSEWVGLEHISRFLHSFQFTRVFFNTIAINVLGLIFGFPVPIILALLINKLGSRRLKAFIQTDLNLGASQIIQTYVYDVGLKSAQFSYSAAISLFKSVLNMILLLVFNQVAKRAGHTSLF